MKKTINKKNFLIIFYVIILIATILLGVITRISFGQSCYDETKYPSATLSRNGDYGAIMNVDEVVECLEGAPYILVVNHINSEEKFECTKSTVIVKQVINGDDINIGDEIILYEYNNFSTYQMQGETLHYINRNPVNLMNNTDDYLVFLTELNLNDAYKKYNPIREFSQFGELEMISIFNISKPNQIFYNNENTALSLSYSDVKEQEFVCFSQDSLNTLNSIKNEMISKYAR